MNKQDILNAFREEFNEDTVFGSDNFEDPKHIKHPCYNHYGVVDAFENFLLNTLTEFEREAYEKGKLTAYENVVAWTEQCDPHNDMALSAHRAAVSQTKYALEKEKHT